MQKHPVLGAEILTPIAAFADAIPIVRYHHERLDGGGYPDGLIGDEIPFLARLLTVADVYDALVSDRPYRVGLLPAEAIEVMRADVGTFLDPAVVAAFLAVLEGEGDSARFVDARPGRVAVVG
jgi:HD-GYP domain-containing protein (c-di-GMP phosphodiesterase class II)